MWWANNVIMDLMVDDIDIEERTTENIIQEIDSIAKMLVSGFADDYVGEFMKLNSFDNLLMERLGTESIFDTDDYTGGSLALRMYQHDDYHFYVNVEWELVTQTEYNNNRDDLKLMVEIKTIEVF